MKSLIIQVHMSLYISSPQSRKMGKQYTIYTGVDIARKMYVSILVNAEQKPLDMSRCVNT